MNDSIQLHTRVGDDGVLKVQVDLGRTEAKKEVVVTVEPLPMRNEVKGEAPLSWPAFVEQTYGSCAGLDLERHALGV